MSEPSAKPSDHSLGVAVRFYFKGDSPANRENEDVRAMAAILDSERAQAREAARKELWSEPYRVFCEKHSEHRPVYTDGRPLLDDSCARCRLEQAEKERDEARASGKVIYAAAERFRLAGIADRERAEAAEARVRELEQEKADYRARFDLIERAQAARIAEARELRAALEKIHGSFGNVAYGGQHHTLCNWARMDDPTQTYCNCGLNDVRALLARTETPKAIVEPAENASNRKE